MSKPFQRNALSSAFTLIEIAIVLVIIGLIVSGVLVGRDLMETAKIRSQISQIEQYRTGVGNFKNKYNALPGDIEAAKAVGLGFPAGSGVAYRSDGNGIIDACTASATHQRIGCENLVFWVHLSQAELSPDNMPYQGNGATYHPGVVTADNLWKYFPRAKIPDNYLHAWNRDGMNYFQIMGIEDGLAGSTSNFGPTKKLTPTQASAIDVKLDDGRSGRGSVIGSMYFIEGTNLGNAGDTTWLCTNGAYNGTYAVGSDEKVCSLRINIGF